MSHYSQPGSSEYSSALAALRSGKIVAYPTETFYGLAVDPANKQAIESLYALKERDYVKQLPFIVPHQNYLNSIVSGIPVPYEKLMKTFWPGPLTLIFSTLDNAFSKTLPGNGSLAVRVSANIIAQQLCALWGGALTATSANVSGQPALISAKEVECLWGDKVGFVLNGGNVPGGNGSTIIRCDDIEKVCHIIREGVVPLESIAAILPIDYTICKG